MRFGVEVVGVRREALTVDPSRTGEGGGEGPLESGEAGSG